MPKPIAPADATSPKRNWSIIKILEEGNEDSMAVALGRWDGEPVIGLRWNGNPESPIGNPQSRGLATWFILEHGKYTEAIISALPSATQKLVREFMPAIKDDALPSLEVRKKKRVISFGWLPKEAHEALHQIDEKDADSVVRHALRNRAEVVCLGRGLGVSRLQAEELTAKLSDAGISVICQAMK